jgi:hypothetical protein
MCYQGDFCTSSKYLREHEIGDGDPKRLQSDGFIAPQTAKR